MFPWIFSFITLTLVHGLITPLIGFTFADHLVCLHELAASNHYVYSIVKRLTVRTGLFYVSWSILTDLWFAYIISFK